MMHEIGRLRFARCSFRSLSVSLPVLRSFVGLRRNCLPLSDVGRDNAPAVTVAANTVQRMSRTVGMTHGGD